MTMMILMLKPTCWKHTHLA